MARISGVRERSTALWRIGTCAAACVASLPAHASFMSGETLDAAANVIALVVIFMVPVVGIVAFWLVHVLPEKIAHKRHHPQRDAIQVLCLLSLVFGGLLWPLAWLWAYTKPVLHQMAYGTDKHEDYHAELAAEGVQATNAPKIATPSDLRADVSRLRGNVERMLAKGGTPEELAAIRDQLAALEPRIGTLATAPAAAVKAEAH
jgi:predicted membrane metal-binding protein